jgi:hypothetical protein
MRIDVVDDRGRRNIKKSIARDEKVVLPKHNLITTNSRKGCGTAGQLAE